MDYMREREANRPLATVVTEKPRFRADVAIFAIGVYSEFAVLINDVLVLLKPTVTHDKIASVI